MDLDVIGIKSIKKFFRKKCLNLIQRKRKNYLYCTTKYVRACVLTLLKNVDEKYLTLFVHV